MTDRTPAQIAEALEARADMTARFARSGERELRSIREKDAELDRAAAAKIREMELALKPFAAVAEHDIGDTETDEDRFIPMTARYARAPLLTVGDLRAARSALGNAND